MHRVSHIAHVSFVGITACHRFVAYHGGDTLVVFALFQAATMAPFGLAASNFGAIAVSAASFHGVISTIGGAAVER